jgi:hypothetical protein
MDDDEISCQIPATAMSGRPGDTTYCHILIELMRLSSTARKRLASARALRQTAEQLLETVRDLNNKLDRLKRSTQHRFCLDAPVPLEDFSSSTSLPEQAVTLRQAQSLQSHYFCLVLDINTPLAYPWSGMCTHSKRLDVAAFAQMEASWNAVAQAARSGILATRQIRVDASCSAL